MFGRKRTCSLDPANATDSTKRWSSNTRYFVRDKKTARLGLHRVVVTVYTYRSGVEVPRIADRTHTCVFSGRNDTRPGIQAWQHGFSKQLGDDLLRQKTMLLVPPVPCSNDEKEEQEDCTFRTHLFVF